MAIIRVHMLLLRHEIVDVKYLTLNLTHIVGVKEIIDNIINCTMIIPGISFSRFLSCFFFQVDIPFSDKFQGIAQCHSKESITTRTIICSIIFVVFKICILIALKSLYLSITNKYKIYYLTILFF